MPRRSAPLPTTLPHPVFTRSEARRAGVSTDRLRARDLRRLTYGLYARKDTPLSEKAILAALTRNDPVVVAREQSAARHWSFPLPRDYETWKAAPELTQVHLTANGGPRRDSTLVLWNRQRLRREEIVEIEGLRVTSRVRTWLDLGRLLAVDELVKIGDHLVRIPRRWAEGREFPHASIDELAAALREHPRSSTPNLRQALDLISVGSDSPAETALRLDLERGHLPVPQLNVRQVDQGIDLGEPDLAWPEWKVCVEHDGPSHRTPEQQQRDISRRELRESLGWIEVQTVAADLHNSCGRGLRRTREALMRHGWRP